MLKSNEFGRRCSDVKVIVKNSLLVRCGRTSAESATKASLKFAEATAPVLSDAQVGKLSLVRPSVLGIAPFWPYHFCLLTIVGTGRK